MDIQSLMYFFHIAHRFIVHIGIDGSAVEHEDLFLQEAIEVGAGEELWGDLAAGNRVDRGLPVVFEPEDKAPPWV
jgi:hypothetical protein